MLIQTLKTHLRHVSAQVCHLQGGQNAILQDELLLGKLLFINSLADGGTLLITAFQRKFFIKSGIFCSLKMVQYTCAAHMSEKRL